MEKQIIKKFNKKYYLLGVRKGDNRKVWLEQANWDCEWYWGLGYVEVFNENYTDIQEHTHFDSLFFKKLAYCYEKFTEYFEETTLDDKEIWQLLENMKSLYILRQYSDFLHIGGANVTDSGNKELIKNEDEYKRINTLVIPKILDKVYEMLGED